jgi:hypothetical protein
VQGVQSGFQDEHQFLEDIYGVQQHGSTVQQTGPVVCTEDRLITFPNVLQHRVEPFRLQDPTRPGHRKILALFLVDPNIEVISTAHVPPQQRAWRERELQREANPGQLPGELIRQVVDYCEDSLSMDEAKEIRLELMEERREFSVLRADSFEKTVTFSLCEYITHIPASSHPDPNPG